MSKLPCLAPLAALLTFTALAQAQTVAPAVAPAPVAPFNPASANPASANPAPTNPAPASSALAVQGLIVLPDNTRLFCVGNEVRQVSPQGETVRRLPLSEPCLGVQASPNGELVLTAGRSSAKVWRLQDGQRVQTVFMASPAGQIAFLSDEEVLIGSGRGLEQLSLKDGKRTLLRPGAVTGVAVAPGGERLLLGDGQKVNLVRRSDFKVVSGIRCEEACPLRSVQFGADKRGAVALAGQTLYALREGRPANVVLRGVTGVAVGFPLPDNGVWVLEGGRVERRDSQTGRREGVLLSSNGTPPSTVLSQAASWNGKGGVLLLTEDRQLVELGPDGRELGRQPLGF